MVKWDYEINNNFYVIGKSPDKSLSQDSSDGSPIVETHRRSKSILKNKSESSVSIIGF